MKRLIQIVCVILAVSLSSCGEPSAPTPLPSPTPVAIATPDPCQQVGTRVSAYRVGSNGDRIPIISWYQMETVFLTATPLDRFGAVLDSKCGYSQNVTWSLTGNAACIPLDSIRQRTVPVSCAGYGLLTAFASDGTFSDIAVYPIIPGF